MKAPNEPFNYVVLRYMHDVFTREFVNVAVLLYAPQTGFVALEKLSSLDRVKRMFPGLQSGSLRDLLGFLASRTEELARGRLESLDCHLLSADVIAKTLLPTDDSALQVVGTRRRHNPRSQGYLGRAVRTPCYPSPDGTSPNPPRGH